MVRKVRDNVREARSHNTEKIRENKHERCNTSSEVTM